MNTRSPLSLVNDDSGPPEDDRANAMQRTLHYHQQTKHHRHRYARSLGYLDWATQPDPFRTFQGAPVIELPLLADRLPTRYDDLFQPGAVAARPLHLETIAVFFELALGLSAWKQYCGSRWALRCNPSSGNLHPTEGYALVPERPSLPAGVYHYVSRDHCLERRCSLEGAAAARLAQGLPAHSFLIGLSSIHWREAWKYGERAFRYCQHDAGHALATVRYAAATLGWSAVLLDDLTDASVAALLGLDRDENFATVAPADREHSDAIVLVGPHPPPANSLPSELVSIVQGGVWTGQANPLSPAHVDWATIDEVAAATQKASPSSPVAVALPSLPPLPRSSQLLAAQLIRQRRSCLALDGKTAIAADTVYRMLDHLLPRPRMVPWDVWPFPPHVHVGLFVHRVNDLPSGLYLFERSATVHDRLCSRLRSGFAWTRPPGCPEHLRLFCLLEGDYRDESRRLSCHQEIASDGAFSLGMIADFGDSIRANGAWWYRRLFWEAGILGQVLYLEAEAAGVRATGIGCYFDDDFHDLLGVKDDCFQSLYHFTVGGPIDDSRLTTLSPYAHRQQA